MPLEILADVDGVLLNWEDSFHAWMNRQGYFPEHKEAYDLWQCYSKVDQVQIKALIETFNASATMGFLPPIDDAIYWVRRMYKRHGVTFHCVTSMGSDPYAQRLRVMNLQNVFGKNVIPRVTILGCGADKTEALRPDANTGKIWLEDNIQNAVVGSSLGLKTFLFNRTYNKPTDSLREPFTRVNNWETLYKILFGDK